MRPRRTASYDAVRRGHKRVTKLQLHTVAGGYEQELPYVDGQLEWSLSRANGVRSGRVTLAGYEWFGITDPGRGTYVTARVEIPGEQWDLGEFPILRSELTRPRGTVELTLGDWCYRRAQPAETSTTLGSTASTVKSVVETYMGHTAPGGVFTITVDDSNGAKVQTPYDLSLGADVWGGLTALANQVGCVIVTTGRQSGQLRKFDAYAPHHDDTDGVVVSETAAIVADEAVNRVIVQAEKSNPEGGTTVLRSVRTLTTGPYRYSRDGIGLLPLVETVRLPEPTQAMVDTESKRLYDRRVGVVRSHALELVPLPWVEVGDVLAYRSTAFGGVPMYGLVDSLIFPLSARGTMRVIMRDSQVVARGGGDG